MKTLRCVILDDEPLAVSLLAEYVNRTPGLELTSSFTDAVAALHYLNTHPCDLLFLDIQMPDITGIQVMKILQDRVRIVLTTAWPEFALDGFEHNALDYLLKPISYERFARAVAKCKPDRAAQPANEGPAFLFVKSEHRLLKVMLDDILWLEGLRDYAVIHHTKGKKILTLQSLRSFEEILPPAEFVRIHKSYLISLSKINFIERSRVFIGDTPLPIGDTFRAGFLGRLGG